MSPDTKLQSSRFEFKYLIDEPTAADIRRFVLHHIEPDKHTVGREGIGYPVHSLYLDSTDFFTCRATLHGEKNRFKLRVRFYDDNPDSPVFLEIKSPCQPGHPETTRHGPPQQHPAAAGRQMAGIRRPGQRQSAEPRGAAHVLYALPPDQCPSGGLHVLYARRI